MLEHRRFISSCVSAADTAADTTVEAVSTGHYLHRAAEMAPGVGIHCRAVKASPEGGPAGFAPVKARVAAALEQLHHLLRGRMSCLHN